ncbi:RHS repeat-associated core domain-containing protein [Dissulfurirhabdus thermomarina]|uniref:RHS repeat-associated core domain-containing protein n=1 Tax=Dissulfurirhabdus thermomarina TaxID=1765737 RepID=A0A6N9TTX7_DISTH|nr:RHS repeat-associated core domain-containing protein [Dissulfurirhabdus thermomarina]
MRYDYAAFGARRRHGGRVRQALVFPGQYLDEETGLHYNWRRYYDPSTGRYITPDPIGLSGGVNLFSYVQNNPINFIDPTGEFLATGTVAFIYYVAIPVATRYGPVAYRAARSAYIQYAPLITDFAEGFLMPTSPPPTPGGFVGYSTRQYLFDPLIEKIDGLFQDCK